MSHVPIETTEEDSADLQFPKVVKKLCDICNQMLHEPYIACGECEQKNIITKTFNICLKCFAKGAESRNHLNSHSYIIIHDNVKIFPNTSWSACEDTSLLNLLMQHNFAWSDISRKINTKSADECRNHYIQNYFDGIFYRSCKLTKYPYCRIEIPHLYRLNSLDPPRKSDMAFSMADYRFTRSDFDTPFDVSAEGVISNLRLDNEWNNEFKHIGESLNCALVTAYNNRLRERHRRNKVVRTHGLILPNRTKSWLAKYSKATGLKKCQDNDSYSGRFVALMQLTTGLAFDRIVEGLQYEYDLRKFLNKLYELRAKGITTCHGGKIFQNAKINRIVRASNVKPSLWEWKHFQNEKDSLTGTEQIMKHCMDLNQLPKKRRSTPLNIIGLSNYEKLSKDEQELCSLIRVIPDSFLTYKKLLTTENNKLGYLRLADARKLIKIDVNKTRVMYDFFFEHGYINKPSQ